MVVRWMKIDIEIAIDGKDQFYDCLLMILRYEQKNIYRITFWSICDRYNIIFHFSFGNLAPWSVRSEKKNRISFKLYTENTSQAVSGDIQGLVKGNNSLFKWICYFLYLTSLRQYCRRTNDLFYKLLSNFTPLKLLSGFPGPCLHIA